MRDLTWMDDALCAQTDPALFHQDGKGNAYRVAQQICAVCPVQADCSSWAQHLEGDAGQMSRHGLWGATAPRARAKAAKEAA